jgi:hypothetical protein
VPNPTQANNVYLSIEEGRAFLADSDLSDNHRSLADIRFNVGYALSASICCRLKNSTRAEAKFNH